jgi:hypothetical protein
MQLKRNCPILMLKERHNMSATMRNVVVLRTPDVLHKDTHRNFIIMTFCDLITTQNGTDCVSKENGCHFARIYFLLMALILRSNTCFFLK